MFVEAVRDAAEQFVPGRVPEAVVDALELVDVEEGHGDLAAVAFGRRQGLRDPIGQQLPVG